MPELPEVQTVCNVIAPQIVGSRIDGIVVFNHRVLANVDEQVFIKSLCKRTFLSMTRRGKYMILSLDSGMRLVIHLRMTGCLLVTDADYPFEKHTHVVLKLQDERQLRFIDPRRFGRFWLLQAGETLQEIEKLGLEPSDAMLTAEYLQSRMRKLRKTIKECLLDQTIIAGIGNIYSDEILHRARIHPCKKANELTEADYQMLASVIPSAMRYYTETNAISPEQYLKSGGRDYQNTPYLQVYGRGGERCFACGEILMKERIGGRSGVYCPACQTLDERI